MLKFDYPSTHSAIDQDSEAQRVIDEEIAAHEAAIRDLKTRRNTHSSISKFPSEILTSIFLLVQSRKPHIGILPLSEEKRWLAVTVVCRRWREIALASVLLWSSIIISQPRRALMLLERSKSAPLQVSSGPCFILSKRGEIVAKKVMCAVERIQTLHVEAQTGQDVFKLLLLNVSVPASQLERLHLSINIPAFVSLPPDILRREMPSLRALHLHNITLPPKLPPLPHLTTLKIFVPGSFALRPSTLLSFFQHSPKLEEIDVACLVKDETPELPRIRAKLPNLLRLSIEADDLETCAILANLEHPRSTSVSFFHFIRPVGEPDLSTFVGLCDHFSGSEVIIIDQVKLSNFHPSFRFSVFSSGGHQGSSLSPCYYDVATTPQHVRHPSRSCRYGPPLR